MPLSTVANISCPRDHSKETEVRVAHELVVRPKIVLLVSRARRPREEAGRLALGLVGAFPGWVSRKMAIVGMGVITTTKPAATLVLIVVDVVVVRY